MVSVAPDDEFGENKKRVAEFFYARLLPKHLALLSSIEAESTAVMDLPDAAF